MELLRSRSRAKAGMVSWISSFSFPRLARWHLHTTSLSLTMLTWHMYSGCITCKKKRLKCDETKPGCHQCQKRSVTCEGYKKDFKWRQFEEATFTTKPSLKARKGKNKQYSCLYTTSADISSIRFVAAIEDSSSSNPTKSESF